MDGINYVYIVEDLNGNQLEKFYRNKGHWKYVIRNKDSRELQKKCAVYDSLFELTPEI